METDQKTDTNEKQALQEPNTKVSTKKKFLIILTIVILILLCGFAGIIIGENLPNKQLLNNTQTNLSVKVPTTKQNQTQKTSCPALQPYNKSADWISYTNPVTCITFQYPKGWNAKYYRWFEDFTKDGYRISIGIKEGDSPIAILAAENQPTYLFGKKLSIVYTSTKNHCIDFNGDRNLTSPEPSICKDFFDTIFLTDSTACFHDNLCTAGTWPVIFYWPYQKQSHLPSGIFITFTAPSSISIHDVGSNQYVKNYIHFIHTVNIPKEVQL